MSVTSAWEKIERWLALYAPEEELPGPADQSDLTRLYDRIGVQLPPDVEQSLLRHNGSGLAEVIPPGYAVYGVEDIAGKYLDRPFCKGAESLYVSIANIGALEMIVDTRNGRLGKHDPVQGYSWPSDPLWASFSVIFDFVAEVLDGPPPWIAVLYGEDEWEAIHDDPDFPGSLTWTEEPTEPVHWDIAALNREFGFTDDSNES